MYNQHSHVALHVSQQFNKSNDNICDSKYSKPLWQGSESKSRISLIMKEAALALGLM